MTIKAQTGYDFAKAQGDHREILMEALAIYAERNTKYKDNWRRFGWRGCLFRIRERAERAWDHWWDADEPVNDSGRVDVDDLLDLINFAAFTIRAIREGNRDGSWFQQPSN